MPWKVVAVWGSGHNLEPDLKIGHFTGGEPGGSGCGCNQGGTYRDGKICGGNMNWGATDVEVWYPR